MAARRSRPTWTATAQKALKAATRVQARIGEQVLQQAMSAAQEAAQRRTAPPPGVGDWLSGMAWGPAGARRYRLFRPAGTGWFERLPLLVMLHGCGQDARSFAHSTGMNRVAAKERFLVLYPEQDRTAHPQGCWNWFGTRSGQAQAEAATIMAAIEQVCVFHCADRTRVAVAGLSAGGSMAALLGTRYPERFRAVAMHSGVAPGLADTPTSALRAMQGKALPEAAWPPRQDAAAWPPLLVIHGGADRVVSAQNAHAAIRLWAETTQATAKPSRTVQRGRRHAMKVTEHKAGQRTVALLCEIGQLAHAWSGGDAGHPHGDENGPDASKLVWAFVEKQFE